jgi:hypothetical protein
VSFTKKAGILSRIDFFKTGAYKMAWIVGGGIAAQLPKPQA